VAFRLQENRWNEDPSRHSSSCAASFDAVEGYDELRAELARQWRVDDAERQPWAREIFDELELADGATRRPLESAAFQARLLRGEAPR